MVSGDIVDDGGLQTVKGESLLKVEPGYLSIFLLVEALDPILLAIADEKTARLVAQAYRTAYDLDAPARVFGRPTAVFRNLAELVSTDEGKQKAWRVLKAFPKR